MSAVLTPSPDRSPARAAPEAGDELPSWVVGVCGVAAVASLLFTALLLLNL
ncbi:MAG: hypothetical protein NTV51_19290 [Verrucomicrobia bacterium]|nr:hypothetical protein [Verrucomicrobiota bacterium]